MDNNIVVKDYNQIDRILKQERKYIIGLIKKIVASGANVLLIQKSILRDAVSDLAMHYLQKKKIIVVKNIERTDIPFICKTLELIPVAHIDNLTADKLSKNTTAIGNISLVDDSRCFQIQVKNSITSTILVRGTN